MAYVVPGPAVAHTIAALVADVGQQDRVHKRVDRSPDVAVRANEAHQLAPHPRTGAVVGVRVCVGWGPFPVLRGGPPLY